MTYTIASSSNTATVIRRFVIWDHPVFSSQSMVIRIHQEAQELVGSYEKFPWHRTRKNVMSKNGSLFQHAISLTINFLLTTNPCRSSNVGMMSNSSRLCFISIFLSLLTSLPFNFRICVYMFRYPTTNQCNFQTLATVQFSVCIPVLLRLNCADHPTRREMITDRFRSTQLYK